MLPHKFGIGDEKMELLPLFQRRIQKLLSKAKETHELDLIQNGLDKIPDMVRESDVWMRGDEYKSGDMYKICMSRDMRVIRDIEI